MSGKRNKSHSASPAPGQALAPVPLDRLGEALQWVVHPGIFQQFTPHGNVTWTAANLVVLAVLWVWSDKATLTTAFAEAHTWSWRLWGTAAVGSYQGLTGALTAYSPTLVPWLWRHLHGLMEQVSGDSWRVGRWLPLAVDGSRVSTPRTQANEKAFQAPHYGKGKTAKYRKKKGKTAKGSTGKKKKQAASAKKRQVQAQTVPPQIWLTLLWHMGLRLPWSWKLGPSHASEREHFQTMLQQQKFPENTLFCGDAGFTGYDLWRSILDRGHSFLIRVGGNVRLLTRLGYYAREREGVVYVWPDAASRKKQPPLVLRLLHLQNSQGEIYLLTNVLDERQLSDAQASRLYHLRWGIELQFRTLKQTFGRSKLRSRTPERASCELTWSLIGLWIVHLFAVKEQLAIGEPPARTSAALALRVIRTMFSHWSATPRSDGDLRALLQRAVIDDYERTSNKQGRYRPQKKDTPSAGRPMIEVATASHHQKLKKYLHHVAATAAA